MLTAKQEQFVQNLINGMSQREAYKNSYDAAAKYGMEGDLVAGANIAGFKKVATAMMEQGCF